MNPYQIMGIIAICASMFAGVVTFLAVQGVPVLLAFICVYVVAIWFMLSLQRRARQASEGSGHPQQRMTDRDSNQWRFSTPSDTMAIPDQDHRLDRRVERRFGA